MNASGSAATKSREFRLTTLALKNRNTVILATLLLAVFGLWSYTSMPMEMFPEVNMPNIFVKTLYPGNPPVDMENLITRPLEKEIHGINGIKELTSVSTQDNSDIFVEFNTGVDIKEALQDVKDAVDKARSELPDDLLMDPVVMDFDFNEFPILSINLSGEYSVAELKEYAEYLQDEIETLTEISKVSLKGLNDREIQINVDQHKLESFKLSFRDIEDAVNLENVSISGGDLKIDGTTRSIRTIGEFRDVTEIGDIIVKYEQGNVVYLRDVATVVDGYADPLTFARLDRNFVVAVQVIKRAGENLLEATDKIMSLLRNARDRGTIPRDLKITITNDQSEYVRDMVSNLENSIIIGMIFVISILFFFLGFRNALFVGFAIPMSMLISFVVLGILGSTVNMMVLFGLVLALGMLVDNAIVVVENIHRFVRQGVPLWEAACRAVGEIAMPIIASTATTLAAFFPLVFWKDIMGEFMKHLPITLIVVLTSSLVVALLIVPVLVSDFLRPENEATLPDRRRSLRLAAILGALAVAMYLSNFRVGGGLLAMGVVLILLNRFFLFSAGEWFRTRFLPWLENGYLTLLGKVMQGKRSLTVLGGTVLLLVFAVVFFAARSPNVVLFPVNEPSFINVTAELPVGSEVTATNLFMQQVEKRIFEILEPHRNIVKSVLTTVGKGVVGENEMALGNTPNRGMVNISFLDYEERKGVKTSRIMKALSSDLLGRYPGVQMSIEKNQMGPPTGRPINIEIIGEDFEGLLDLTARIQQYIENSGIEGIEGLKMDLDVGKPELLIQINRDKARRFGLSTAMIAGTIRTALFGKEISDFKVGEEEYPIQLRLDERYRQSIAALLNQKITFRSPASGKIMQVPISAVADVQPSSTYSSIRRKDMNRVITLYSNVIEGFNPSRINERLKNLLSRFEMPEEYEFRFTGEQEEQQETMSFLQTALGTALALILIILVTQFNSFVKPMIILACVVFSTIGVFLGLAVFRMDFVVIMTGVGIISLAGVVVNNGIVLIDYIDFLKDRRREALGVNPGADLPMEETIACIVHAGKTRLQPVLLTAITTILGLTPMALGMNIDFGSLLRTGNPHLYFGGDNALFWGPMAWTVIFGLAFATFLTLIVVPVMYRIGNQSKLALARRSK